MLVDTTVSHDRKQNPELSPFDLRNIVHSHIGKDEIVPKASLWYLADTEMV